MTNAEWIRSLDDIQLADFLMSICAMGHNGYEPYEYTRDRFGLETDVNRVDKQTYEWLKSEVIEK